MTMDLTGFAIRLTEIEAKIRRTNKRRLKRSIRLVRNEARSVIGVPQPGWPALAESTIDDKTRQGYSTEPDGAPLLRDGTLRMSIIDVVDYDAMDAAVGVPSRMVSHDYSSKAVDIADVAKWQELGTEHTPARSFLAGSITRKVDDIQQIMFKGLKASFSSNPVSDVVDDVVSDVE
jgi:hypothetical protein